MRVYIGSFWEGPCQNPDLAGFFRAEQSDLLRDLHVSVVDRSTSVKYMRPARESCE